MTLKPLDLYLATAHSAGCPSDQLLNFRRGNYVPQPKQLAFSAAARECDEPGGPTLVGFGGARGPGKALSTDTMIPTMDGWKTMGQIEVGDFVFAPDGNPTHVSGCSPVQFNRPCFEVKFSDGGSIVADAEHLWVTFSKSERAQLKRRCEEYREHRRDTRPSRGTGQKPYLAETNRKREYSYLSPPVGTVRTTQEILDTLYSGTEINHSIKLAEPLIMPAVDLPLDPYVLGAWLGDGDSARGYLTTADEEMLAGVSEAGFSEITHRKRYRYHIKGLTTVLNNTGLLHNKVIPPVYFRASLDQRLRLLQGLMDTDGYVDRDGACEFTSTSYPLAYGVFELAISLGIKATILEGKATLKGKYISPKWRVRFSSSLPVFRLSRKASKQKRQGFNSTVGFRYIVDIRPVSSVPVKCITVEDPTHCYLASERLIPTHNSHGAFAQVALDDCQRVPGLKCLYLRKVGKKAREQFEDLRRAVLRFTDHRYNRQEGVVYFPNEARILIGHFNNESDIDDYLGTAYDLILTEEATTLTLTKRQAVRDSNRSSIPGWRPRMYDTTNPGGVGHAWFKALYIDPARAGHLGDTRFIFATVEDNRFIDQDYQRKLEQNTGWRLRAYRYGDWDIVAGQFFTNFRHEVHVLPPGKYPFQTIPANWPVWGSLDYGHAHPTSAHLHTTGDGIIYTVGEHWAQRTPIKRHAEALHDLCQRWGRVPRFWYAGLDCFAKRESEEDSPTIAQKYKAEGIILKPANVNRISGASELSDRLGEVDQGIEPRWFIFDTCPKLIECLPTLEHDPNRPEDVLKVDIDENGQGGDDSFDSARYGLISVKQKREVQIL